MEIEQGTVLRVLIGRGKITWLQTGEVRKVAVFIVMIQTVANDKLIRDLKRYKIWTHFNRMLREFVQQNRSLDRRSTMLEHHSEKNS